MKIISRKFHAFFDYIMGIVLLLWPWPFFQDTYVEANSVMIFLGSLILIYSMLTRYEYGIFPVISIKIHLVIDYIAGIFLAASPWVLGFAEATYLPHLLFGISIVVVAFLTDLGTEEPKIL